MGVRLSGADVIAAIKRSGVEYILSVPDISTSAEVGRQVIHGQAPVGEPEIEVGFGAREDHIQAPEGPGKPLLYRFRLLLLLASLRPLAYFPATPGREGEVSMSRSAS